jgi:hypothetical protein
MSDQRITFKFEDIGIAKVFERERLQVPLNQRDYSWEEKQVREVLQDLSKAVSDNKPTYFLGTIVLTEIPKRAYEVADGQQRLATISILLAAIRDYFLSKGKEKLANSIESDFLFKVDRNTEDSEARLSLNVNDNEFFKKRILSRPGTTDRKFEGTMESHKLIESAFQMAHEHISRVLSPHAESNHIPFLNKWVDFLRESAVVILLKVPDSINAYVMFETLNDRGLKMAGEDLVKNYLFGASGNRLKEAQQCWAKMFGALESVEQEDITITFLRHICSALYGLTREREVFEKIKNNVSGSFGAISYLSNLDNFSLDYVAMLTEDSNKWNKYPAGIRNSIATLNLLNVLSIRPIMFAVAHKFSPREAEKAFNMFISWTVRFFVCGGSTSGAVEDAYANTARKIMESEVKNCDQLLGAMENIIASDTEFEEAFRSLRVSKEYLARYYLRSLEMTARKQQNPSWVPSESPESVNLEHVLPKNYENHWGWLDEETAGAYLKRLGNLALFEAKKNTEVDDLEFSKKKLAYRDSTFKLTEMIAKQQTWGVDEINDRQKKLAELAVKTWPLSVK